MGLIGTLPRTNQTGPAEWSDVETNDERLRQEIDGNLENANIKAGAGISHSKLANSTAGYILLANASGVITGTVMSGDVTIDSSGVTNIGADKVGVTEIGPTLPSVRAVRSTVQTIGTLSATAVQFNAADTWDTDAFHDTVTNNTRLTVPTGKDGVYVITGGVIWDGDTAGTYRVANIRLGGTTNIASNVMAGINMATLGLVGSQNSVTAIYDLDAAQYVELVVEHDKGSNLDINSAHLAMAWIGPPAT